MASIHIAWIRGLVSDTTLIAGESFRWAGGLLLDGSGHRFCNELGPSQHILSLGELSCWLSVTGDLRKEMEKGRKPYRLVLPLGFP